MKNMAEKQGRVSSKRSTGTKYKELDKKFKVLVVFGIIFCIAGIPMIIWGGMWAYNTYTMYPSNGGGGPVIIPKDPPGSFTLNTISSPDTDGVISLSWTSSSDASYYHIYRRINYIGQVYGSPIKQFHTSLSYTDIVSSNSYVYKIEAVNLEGRIFSNTRTVAVIIYDTPVVVLVPPNTPLINYLSPTPDIDGDIYLRWGIISDATSYIIYRSINGGAFSNLVTISGTSYYDNDLSDGVYRYKVKARNADGVSGFSDTQSVTVQNYVYIPIIPIAPTVSLITPNPDTDGSVEISWNSVSDATSYELYRNNVKITTIASTLYIDSGLADGTYYYKVICVGVDGNSGYSITQSVTVQNDVLDDGNGEEETDYTMIYI